ncbi:MAG TPA: DapH/DapD/GlmU-related protein [Woeseiaceae bacterium]|nr:DapH/DapD/GlmU-related protein [Woeseiaceae bacterium]
MNHPDKDARGNTDRQRQRSRLDDTGFIRARLFDDDRSAFSRYTDLVFHSFTWPKLIRYELLTLFIGPMPGALGLVLRKWLFPSLFRKTGKNVLFGPNLTLRHADRITLGDGVVLDRDCLLDARGAGDAGIVIGDRVIVSGGAAIQAKVGHIEIGSDCNIGSHADIVAQGPIVIEDHVSIAGNAMIAGGRYVVELDGTPGNTQRFTSGSIRLARNVRIGMAAIVQDGVSIGENAIVAPGSVVYESVAANSVVWGNPARPVRDRPGAANTPPRDEPARPARGGNGSAQTDTAVRQQICEYLQEDLFIEFGAGEYGTADSLVDAGILDSLALVRLSLWIEQRFGIDIDLGGLDPSAIGSVDKIAEFVGRRSGR